MRNDGRQAASAVLLFSPWVDVTLTTPEIARLERRDPMLSRAMLVQAGLWWAGARSPVDPVVSPVHDHLADLPPVFTYIGGHDLLLADARKLDQRIRAAGGESTLRVWPSGFHVFMAAQSTREAQQVMVDVSGKLRPVA
jgi:acetyl esterase/lipase